MQHQIFQRINKAREQDSEGVQAYVQAEASAICDNKEVEWKREHFEAEVSMAERLESAMLAEGERLEASMLEIRSELDTVQGVLHSRVDDL